MRATVVLALLLSAVLIGLTVTAVTVRAHENDDHGGNDSNDADQIWVAMLRGANEVPARDTPARGLALFLPRDDGSVDYLIIVHRISNVVMAHIHCGAPGVAGPVGVTLFMGTPGGGPFNGLLVKASFTAPDANNKCGWTTNADVMAAGAAGMAYVNVHTNDGVDPPNTGPGDFPGGEIRGPLMLHDDD